MCKFCKGYEEKDLDDVEYVAPKILIRGVIDLGILGKTPIYTHIREPNTLAIEIQGLKSFDVEIKYCPMCGRKLI